MKLILKNFRCYKEKIFELGNNGITLLQGKSGAGKTTILMAINFVLYGVGTNLIHEGANSCYIELYFNDIYIKRTKKPNKLILKYNYEENNRVEYEDDSAQNIINKIFTESFDICGYIAQNAVGTFITMSPTDKLEFLEKIVFSDINLSEIKNKCKNIIKNLNEKLIDLNSKIEITKNVLETKIKPSKLKYPLKCGIKNREIGEKNVNIRLKKCINIIKTKTKELNELTLIYEYLDNKNKEVEINNTKLNNINVEILNLEKTIVKEDIINELKKYIKIYIEYDNILKNNKLIEVDIKTREFENKEINDKLQEYNKNLKSINYCGDIKLNEYKNILIKLIKINKNNLLVESYNKNLLLIEKFKNEEINIIKQKIVDMEKELWKEYDKTICIENINKYINIYKDLQLLDDINDKIYEISQNVWKYKYTNINYDNFLLEPSNTYYIIKCNINNKIINIEKETVDEISLIIQQLEYIKFDKQYYKCPYCNNSLKIEDDKLTQIDKCGKYDILDEYKIFNNLNIKEIDKLILNYSNDKHNFNKLIKQKNDISIIETDINLSDIETKIEYLKQYKITNENNEKIYKKYKLILENIDSNYSNTLINLIKDTNNIKNEIDRNNKYLENAEYNDLYKESEIRDIINQNEIYKEKVNNILENISMLDNIYKNNNEIINNKKNEISKIINYRNDNLETLNKFDSIYKLNNLGDFKLNNDDKIKLFNTFIENKEKELIYYTSLINKREEIYNDNNRHFIDIKDKYNKDIDENNIIKEIKEIKEQINKINEIIKTSENEKIEYTKQIDEIEKYIEYESQLKEYELWYNKLENLIKEENEIKSEYTASCILKEKIIESESISMINVIDSINNHANIYLEDFFPDNPILVRLLSFREIKKSQKPQINIEIQYKGMECDIKYLSGGELSRVILAFTLALSDMFNIPLIMLDEVTSSLDQDMNSIIVESIKNHLPNKHILIISHQSLTGIYDRIINI